MSCKEDDAIVAFENHTVTFLKSHIIKFSILSIFEQVRTYKSFAEHASGDTGKNRLFISPVIIINSGDLF